MKEDVLCVTNTHHLCGAGSVCPVAPGRSHLRRDCPTMWLEIRDRAETLSGLCLCGRHGAPTPTVGGRSTGTVEHLRPSGGAAARSKKQEPAATLDTNRRPMPFHRTLEASKSPLDSNQELSHVKNESTGDFEIAIVLHRESLDKR